MHRFYLPVMGSQGDAAPLPPEEAQHVLRVLRLEPGDEVRVFDGRGRERVAVIEALTRSDAIVRLGSEVSAAAEPRVKVTLAQALLKGDKFDEVVRDATMLGIVRVQPLLTARCEVPRAKPGDTGRVERWHRVAVSSAKQCGRAVVPDVAPVASLESLLAESGAASIIMLAEPGVAHGSADDGPSAAPLESALVLVGPEGGWTEDERDLARRHRATFLTLGQRTLRADRAAIIALSVLMRTWGDL